MYNQGIPCKQVKLPYDVTKKDGKDVRHFLINDGTAEDLRALAAKASASPAPTTTW